MNRFFITTLATVALVASSITASADALGRINYQGRLVDDSGIPLPDGETTLTFRIFNAATGGAIVWGPQDFNGGNGLGQGPRAVLDNGYFNVTLGPVDTSGSFLSQVVPLATGNLFVEIAVNGAAPISPRQQLLSAPFALTATGYSGDSLSVFADNGSRNVLLSVVSNNGNDADFGFMGALNDTGANRAFAFASPSGDAGVFRTHGPNGEIDTAVSFMTNDANHGYIAVHQETGTEMVAILSDPDNNYGQVRTRGDSGSFNTFLGGDNTNPDLGYIGVQNGNSSTRADMLVFSAGQGIVRTRGPNGNLNVLLSGDAIGSLDHGAVNVYDENGIRQAGMVVDNAGNGIVFGDAKQFVTEHPDRPGYEIVYVSLEGPEAAMFHRGTAKLENGRGTIQLPDHFSTLAAEGTLTVQYTPNSIDSKGIATISKSNTTIEFGELLQGTGTYDIDYVVHATRQAFIDHDPVRRAPGRDPAAGPVITPYNQHLLTPPAAPGGSPDLR